MAYSDFTLPGLINQFQLAVIEDQQLLAEVKPAAVPPFLADVLRESAPLALAINTEKARAEMIIAPILIELRKLTGHRISLFSGVDFPVAPEQGLTGFCDYLISRSPHQLFIVAPVLVIFEAKNENIKGGLAQCLAAMLAAQLFNARRQRDRDALRCGDHWQSMEVPTAGRPNGAD